MPAAFRIFATKRGLISCAFNTSACLAFFAFLRKFSRRHGAAGASLNNCKTFLALDVTGCSCFRCHSVPVFSRRPCDPVALPAACLPAVPDLQAGFNIVCSAACPESAARGLIRDVAKNALSARLYFRTHRAPPRIAAGAPPGRTRRQQVFPNWCPRLPNWCPKGQQAGQQVPRW